MDNDNLSGKNGDNAVIPLSVVFCGDCMELMSKYPDKYFGLAVVDPPYRINAGNMQMGSAPNRKGKITNDIANKIINDTGSIRLLAKKYGIGKTQIGYIKQGKRWQK